MDAWRSTLTFYARLALGTAFLSAVADRFGLWGPSGAAHVAWGNMDAFLAYAGKLNWFLPAALQLLAAWTATVLEVALGLLLIVGYRLRTTALSAGALLGLFALAMTFSTGVKTAFDASVYSASAAACLLAFLAPPHRGANAGRS